MRERGALSYSELLFCVQVTGSNLGHEIGPPKGANGFHQCEGTSVDTIARLPSVPFTIHFS